MLPEDWLPDEELLGGELLEDELLDDELLDDELLDDELLLELLEGELVLGVDGVCGVVGLLALGQPLSSRQAHAGSDSLAIHLIPLSINCICPDNLLRRYRFPGLQSRPEPGVTQCAHDPVGVGPVGLLIFVDPFQVDDPAAFVHPEF